jgi:hypothetical protein
MELDARPIPKTFPRQRRRVSTAVVRGVARLSLGRIVHGPPHPVSLSRLHTFRTDRRARTSGQTHATRAGRRRRRRRARHQLFPRPPPPKSRALVERSIGREAMTHPVLRERAADPRSDPIVWAVGYRVIRARVVHVLCSSSTARSGRPAPRPRAGCAAIQPDRSGRQPCRSVRCRCRLSSRREGATARSRR